jgi:hypothetical protein
VRRYHHIGIPTAVERPGETYLEQFKVHVSGYDTSEFGIEWMRFEPDCELPELVQTVPHIAFQVDDLETELAGRDILTLTRRRWCWPTSHHANRSASRPSATASAP